MASRVAPELEDSLSSEITSEFAANDRSRSAARIIGRRPIRVLDNFAFDRAVLKPSHVPLINHVARHLFASWRSGTPIRTVRIVGHTDNSGRRPYNTNLGRKRAASVHARLIAAIEKLGSGLSQKIRFVMESAGASRPAVDNKSALGRAANRRVEIFLVI